MDYDHKHAGEPRHTCQVKGCPEDGMASLADGSWLCAWHHTTWAAFLREHQMATGEHVRLGKYGNWHIRLSEFIAWAEKHPTDRTVLPW